MDEFVRLLSIGILILSIVLVMSGMRLRASLAKAGLTDDFRADICAKMWKILMLSPFMIFAIALGLTVAIISSFHDQTPSLLFLPIIGVLAACLYNAFSWRRLERYYRTLHKAKPTPPS